MAAFIAAQRAEHDVPRATSCRALQVSEEWFYKWRHGDASPAHARRAQLTAEIKRLFAAHRGTYGSPRITADLREEGWQVSENTVAAIMREQGLAARRKKQRRSSTRPGRGRWRAPDLIGRKFPATTVNRKWYGDGTEIETDEGKLYLDSVLDMGSRRVIGIRAPMGDCNFNGVTPEAEEAAVTEMKVLDEAVDAVVGAGDELDAVDDQLVEQLADRARSRGLQLTGEGGLLARLTKRVVESALEGELDDHLGYRKPPHADGVGWAARPQERGRISTASALEEGPKPERRALDRDRPTHAAWLLSGAHGDGEGGAGGRAQQDAARAGTGAADARVGACAATPVR